MTEVERIAKGLTTAWQRNLFALPGRVGVWATVSEMRGQGATGGGMDLLHVMNNRLLTDRRWVKWGGERGQLRGEGYEYMIKPLGLAVRDHLKVSEAPQP